MSDPRSDRVFKQIFQHHPKSLMLLLNSFLPLIDPIEYVQYMPVELPSELSGLHMPIVDVRCRDSSGRQFIVEMQLQKKPLFFRRVVMNACRIYSRQGRLGAKLEDVCPVYTLCLLDYPMFKRKDVWLHHVEPSTLGPDMEPLGELYFTFVEMRKWLESGTFDMENIRDAWMLFFTQPEKMKEIYTPEQRKRYKEMWEAVDAWDLTKHSEHDLWVMDKIVQDMWTHEAYVLQARDEGLEQGRQQGIEAGRQEGFKQGREEGLQKGLEKGIQQGMQQGIQQGMQEGMKKGIRQGYDTALENLLNALQYLKDHPSTSDEELMRRFGLFSDMVARIRSMI
jgi:predicted transposase/invertase (TIGR01784 family)